ncbi:DUF4381 domain-containing protein [Legionella parisiensis]|uniref:DUF4381 domain-containing protein n=1 Tax=Legionella parisiensis TaxID=45071 RepID=A0A1E5JLZ9_9GAMM|nr:DUF4381 domain-containing protein [Legionella parisiensis]KTD42691.1 hypothetical protein Lpar_0668 [Legionella parisiensis]OEH45577.1 hypothetical protein lpari_03305 [Legionella parisiensis]STX71630.1 Uncharacterised protein [Legionella parisiensis]
MANTDALAQLKDIHLPTPIGWWPLAPGWYVLLGLVLFLVIILAYWIYKKYRNALAKKHALLLLDTYQKEYEEKHNGTQSSARISELLRRVALVYYPREQVASLHGEKWLNFLNETSKGIDFNLVKDLLLDAPFKTGETMDLKPLFSTAQLWIKQRGVPCSN